MCTAPRPRLSNPFSPGSRWDPWCSIVLVGDGGWGVVIGVRLERSGMFVSSCPGLCQTVFGQQGICTLGLCTIHAEVVMIKDHMVRKSLKSSSLTLWVYNRGFQGLKLLALEVERSADLLANLLFPKCLFLGQSGIYKKHRQQMEKASSLELSSGCSAFPKATRLGTAGRWRRKGVSLGCLPRSRMGVPARGAWGLVRAAEGCLVRMTQMAHSAEPCCVRRLGGDCCLL